MLQLLMNNSAATGFVFYSSIIAYCINKTKGYKRQITAPLITYQ